MTYEVSLILLINIQLYCIQAQDKITDITEDDQSFLVHDILRTRSVDKTKFTVGNTKCRYDNTCGFAQNTAYSWCYTDKGWDYCCTGDCFGDPEGSGEMYCRSGPFAKRCGYGGSQSITGKSCTEKYPCGVHDSYDSVYSRYWCKYDYSNWDTCCSPLDKCRDRFDGYGNWCYTGIVMKSRWSYCIP